MLWDRSADAGISKMLIRLTNKLWARRREFSAQMNFDVVVPRNAWKQIMTQKCFIMNKITCSQYVIDWWSIYRCNLNHWQWRKVPRKLMAFIEWKFRIFILNQYSINSKWSCDVVAFINMLSFGMIQQHVSVYIKCISQSNQIPFANPIKYRLTKYLANKWKHFVLISVQFVDEE